MSTEEDRSLTAAAIDRRKFIGGVGTGVAAGVAGCLGGDGDTPTPSPSPTDGNGDSTPTDTPGGGTVQGGTPTIGMAVAPTTLNPLVASTTYEFLVIDRVMGYGVTNHPQTLDFKPWLITDWTLQSKNAKKNPSAPTLKDVTLREDLTFHDGEDVTAEDLKFSIEYFKEQNPTGSLTGAAQQNVAKVEATGDYTADIYMSAKDQRWFTNILGWPILPKHIWGDVSDYTKYSPKDAEEGLVGCGAFKLTDFNWQNWFELEIVDDVPWAQADYVDWLHEDAPFIDGIRFEIFGSQNAMEQALLNGDIDGGFIAGGFTVNTAVKAENSDSLSVHQSSESGYNHISYNMRRVPFDDVAFRQFLNKTFDKTWVVQEPYNDIGAVAGDYTVIPALETWRPPAPQELAGGTYSAEGISGSLLNESGIQSDTENMPDLSFPGTAGSFNMNENQVKKARQFLLQHSEAKHDYSFGEAKTDLTTAPDGKELYVNGQHISEAHTDNNGNGGQGPLVFSFQPPQEDLYQARYGQQWTGMLKKVGIPVQPLVKTINAQIPTVYSQEDFDMFSMGWGLGVNATHFAGLYSSEGADLDGTMDAAVFNPMGYTGADPLIMKDLSFMDFSKRTPVVKQICAEIYRDAPTNITDVAQLLEPTNNTWQGWIGGLGTTINEDSFLNIHQTE